MRLYGFHKFKKCILLSANRCWLSQILKISVLWQGQIYKFVCFPNGLAICPRKFTKLLKPAFAYLRKHGNTSVVFIDDSWLKSGQYDDCIENIVATLSLLDKLGFTVHPEKSILIPTQRIVFLGFVLDSLKCVVSFTPERAQKIIEACQKLLQTARK